VDLETGLVEKISWTEHMTNEQVLMVGEQRSLMEPIQWRRAHGARPTPHPPIFLKIFLLKLFQKLEIWACKPIIFSIFSVLTSLIVSFQSTLKIHVKLHKIAYKLYNNCLQLGVPRPTS